MRHSRSRLQTFHSRRSQQQQSDFPPQVGSCRVCGPWKVKEGTEGDTPSLFHGWPAQSSISIYVLLWLCSLQT